MLGSVRNPRQNEPSAMDERTRTRDAALDGGVEIALKEWRQAPQEDRERTDTQLKEVRKNRRKSLR